MATYAKIGQDHKHIVKKNHIPLFNPETKMNLRSNVYGDNNVPWLWTKLS